MGVRAEIKEPTRQKKRATPEAGSPNRKDRRKNEMGVGAPGYDTPKRRRSQTISLARSPSFSLSTRFS